MSTELAAELQAWFNVELDKLHRIGPIIRRDCIHRLEEKELLAFGVADRADLEALLQGFRSWEGDRQFQIPGDRSGIDYEIRLAEDAERLIATLRAEPCLDGELDGGWRYAFDEEALDVPVDISDLIAKLRILALSARQSIEGLSATRDLLPKTKARAAPDRYFLRLILLAYWRYVLKRSEGVSNGAEDIPHGPLVDFVVSMIVDETPAAFAAFEYRNRSKVVGIARRFMPPHLVREPA